MTAFEIVSWMLSIESLVSQRDVFSVYLYWSYYDHSSCWIHKTRGRKPGCTLPKAPPLLLYAGFPVAFS